MLSKALFKQSCKANGIMWAIITVAVCIMLACVMLISGNGNIGTIRNGITNTMMESSIDSSTKSRAINYYTLSNKSLDVFDSTFLATYSALLASGTGAEEASAAAYQTAFGKIVEAMNSTVSSLGYNEDSDEAKEIQGFFLCPFNPDINQDGVGDFKYFYDAYGSDIQPYSLATISSPNREQERKNYAKSFSSVFLAGNMVSDENIEKILKQLDGYNVSKEDFKKLTYEIKVGEITKKVSRYMGESGYVYMKNISENAIVSFRARLENEMSKIDTSGMTSQQITQKESQISAEITKDISSSFLSTLPEEVSSSLREVGSMDLFSLIVGLIFFKMAGLLLPIIYIIMASNNLIAGQVDSGSMAYVLSTSTKRRQVVFTQAMFLIGSLFAMFLMTTITSFVCLSTLNNDMVTMSYGDFALLNLGAFITLFAMSGISFLASCCFNRSKHSMSIGGGLNMFFLVATMLGLFGSKVLPSIVRLNSLNFFNYCTIISLFDDNSILAGTTTFVWKLAILLAIGIVCYVVGAVRFNKKDLPL